MKSVVYCQSDERAKNVAVAAGNEIAVDCQPDVRAEKWQLLVSFCGVLAVCEAKQGLLSTYA